MNNTEAGWYPDPSGDDSFLRYWDGGAWTDQTLPTRTQSASAAKTADTDEHTPAATTTTATYEQAYTQQQSQPQQPQVQAAQSQQPQQPYAQPQQPPATTTNIFIQTDTPICYQGAIYPMTNTDRTLRLLAFIWNVLMIVCTCFAIIPLAWIIPMTVRSWGIYKGTKPNTVAFGVCNILFTGMISGILLLCSNKDQ